MKALMVAAVGAFGAVAAGAAPNLGRLTPIPLHAGINHVPNFAPDGRNAEILLAWRDNGNAHGYDFFVVTLPSKETKARWSIVGFQNGNDFSDELTDAPHTGEDVAKAVRFVRERSNGAPLVVTATRRIVESYSSPAGTTIAVYGLRSSKGLTGTTQDYFTVIRQWKAKRLYCNAELALRDELSLPVRKSYRGSLRTGGC